MRPGDSTHSEVETALLTGGAEAEYSRGEGEQEPVRSGGRQP